jgi:transcriptional regulator with XRE-family HTH domain
MDEQKSEFIKLIRLMGWTQTEAGRKLGKTPSAINHLLNPMHPNKPTLTTMLLLKMYVNERNAVESDLIQQLKDLPSEQKENVNAVIRAALALTRQSSGRES